MFHSLIEFRTRTLRLSRHVKARALSSLQRLLRPHLDRIPHVLVRFTDVNGPKGGEDVLCAIQVSVTGRGGLQASHRAATPWEALSGAERRLRTMLDRGRDRERVFAPFG
jgi:hypothetical protein